MKADAIEVSHAESEDLLHEDTSLKRNYERKILRRGVIAAVCAFLCLLLGALVFMAVFFVLGAVVFEKTFFANPSAEGGSACYNLNRDKIHPSNLGALSPPCGYNNLTKSLFPSLSVPRSNWSYVTFNSRLNSDTNAVESTVSLKGILMTSDVDHDPFIIVVHGIRTCKEDKNVIIPAAMLWRNSFNVLVIDLRNHGQSEVSRYSYATFGDQEHHDVLGAIDYLVSTYPRLKGQRHKIGLYGVSMGGATSTIAFAKDQGQYLNVLWLDSAALNVYRTLMANFERFGFSSTFLMNAMCSIQRTKWPFGCPPFQYDPLGMNIGSRHVYITSKLDDKVVPIFNAYDGISKWTAQGVNVTSFFAIDKNAPVGCTHHVDMVMFDPSGYESRMIHFFNDHLNRD
jgi:pimeloyl-ACP methyl ester carboxylesterase